MEIIVDYFEVLFEKTSSKNISSDHIENTNALQNNNTVWEPPSVNQAAANAGNQNTQDFPFL